MQAGKGFDVGGWRGRRVLVLGDVMLDRFVYGHVERISPEGPIPVLRFDNEKLMLGGAANVARNIASLGGVPVLVGVLGEDAEADLITGTLLGEDGIEGRLLRHGGHPTTVKTRFVAAGQQMLRLDVEKMLVLDAGLRDRLAGQVEEAIEGLGAIVLSDYAKGVLSPELVSAVMAIAARHGVPVVVDPKRVDASVYRGARVMTPNALEALQATGFDTSTDEGAEAAARMLCEKGGVQSVVLTRGAQGMTIYAPGEEEGSVPVHIPTAASEVFDVSGAGDTVIATLSLGIAAGLPIARAAALANAAAGVAVAKLGTAAVHASELQRALFDRSVSDQENKVLGGDDAIAQVRRWQAEGRSVGFTNGCFDLVHPGHIAILQKARAACDRLVVALNTDASVKRLKGPSRPVQTETARAIVMASIGAVDLVTLFDEDTPIDLIEALRPDVLIKGADYRIDQVVGADIVRQQGGRVVLIPIEEGHSTTSIIARAG
ncbi:D-glycero-beta-D-manno-heptose-7-phosphate kinase [Sphingomonas oryzagri]|uniref:Bifunctional protein HldE n=1 Tax=Sphingomonas oryzagri TaxID=3042314 RepID=A0ABT6MW99_9SPHN|nr:D-glycero-beta-D-manno-heptose-7-phosphate kinase [Sphingomonas oryzagri]MDH7637269.1 D-glycero-beta-D-manno-heptose-7-phosphate kinase [Sphingomonas oryzagri]